MNKKGIILFFIHIWIYCCFSSTNIQDLSPNSNKSEQGQEKGIEKTNNFSKTTHDTNMIETQKEEHEVRDDFVSIVQRMSDMNLENSLVDYINFEALKLTSSDSENNGDETELSSPEKNDNMNFKTIQNKKNGNKTNSKSLAGTTKINIFNVDQQKFSVSDGRNSKINDANNFSGEWLSDEMSQEEVALEIMPKNTTLITLFDDFRDYILNTKYYLDKRKIPNKKYRKIAKCCIAMPIGIGLMIRYCPDFLFLLFWLILKFGIQTMKTMEESCLLIFMTIFLIRIFVVLAKQINKGCDGN